MAVRHTYYVPGSCIKCRTPGKKTPLLVTNPHVQTHTDAFSMSFNFFFRSRLLLQDVQSLNNTSESPQNGHSGSGNALPTIEEVEDSDLQGLPSGKPLSIGAMAYKASTSFFFSKQQSYNVYYNQQSANMEIVEEVSSAAQSSIPGTSNS